MKLSKLLFFLSFFVLVKLSVYAQVKIGYNSPPVAANNNSWLELTNNSGGAATTWRGVLLPKVDFTNTVSFPSNTTWGIAGSASPGVVVYNTANRITNGFSGSGIYCWSGTQWVWLKSQPVNTDWSTTGNQGTTAGTNFLGTTDNVSLVFKTNNTERMRISNTGTVGIGHSGPVANLHLYGVGTSGYIPSPAYAGGGPEVAFSAGLFTKPGATIQMLDYNGYSGGLSFNVHKGSNNGGGGANADNWPSDVIQAITIENNGNVGINATDPATTLHVNGGLTLEAGASVSLTADGQTITVGNRSYLRVSSNNGTAANRTVYLSDGLYIGQVLFIECISNAFEVQDNDATSNANLGALRQLGVNDQLHLIWNGTSWLEVSFANN